MTCQNPNNELTMGGFGRVLGLGLRGFEEFSVAIRFGVSAGFMKSFKF